MGKMWMLQICIAVASMWQDCSDMITRLMALIAVAAGVSEITEQHAANI